MSTSQTPNYGLHQWAGEDQFKRTEFNEDNAKLDAALHGLRGDVDAKATQTALNALTTKVNGKAEQSALTALTATVNGKANQTALDALTARVSAKADQSALNALSATVNTKGNCRIVTGTYTGRGTFGKNNPNTLTFDQKPLAVLITGNSDTALLLPCQSRTRVFYDFRMIYWALTWSGTSVSWYFDKGYQFAGSFENGKAEFQHNTSGQTYYYTAFFAAG